MTPDEAQAAVVRHFGKDRTPKLDYAKQADRHRGFFVGRRARSIGGAHAALLADPGLVLLKARIGSEFAQLHTFLERKISDLKLGPDKSPPHLDLADLAKAKTTTRAEIARNVAAAYQGARAKRIRSIGWRAAAIHAELWTEAPDASTSALKEAELHQLIDRRLRIVERMNFQIASAFALGGRSGLEGGGPRGPWRDGFRIRMFEYPRIAGPMVKKVRSFVGDENIEPPGTEPFVVTSVPWLWETGKRRLLYNVSPEPGLKFALSVLGDWVPDAANPYIQNLEPAPPTTAAEVFDRMFTPDVDWWGRSWLFCDHVISALHLESLLFSLRRRDPAQGESRFNQLARPGFPHPLSLAAFVAMEGRRKLGRLMAADAVSPPPLPPDPFFHNDVIDEEDLQIGDHLVFYNSRVFNLVSESEWSLENSIVIDIDSDEQKRGGMFRGRLKLQGHGTAENPYAAYLAEVALPLNQALNHVRAKVREEIASHPGTTKIKWLGMPDRLVRWDPYEAFPFPGAWWIHIPAKGDIAGNLGLYAGSVAPVSDPGPGYHPPPDLDAVYFPLFRPKFRDFWTGYLKARRVNEHLPRPKLADFPADASITPGIFYRGKKAPVPVLRPLVV